MGTSGPQMDRRIKALRNFKIYEDKIQTYLNKKSFKNESLEFYLVPKDYITCFCNIFNYRNNISELTNLNVYHDSKSELEENTIIEKDIIKGLSEKNKVIIENKIKLPKINNNILINDKNGSNCTFKLNNEGLFIPISYNIWDKLNRYYGYDITLKRKGFSNKGELFILTEENRIDCFFKNIKTRDVIYHFCFMMKDKKDINKLINFFKDNSAKELIEILEIKYVGNNNKKERFKKIQKNIPNHITIIGGTKIIIYFLDSYIFKENREFETITFEVEKNLKKPHTFYETTSKDIAFNKILKNESLEILMSNFNIEEKEFFNEGKKSLIQGLILAYKNHYPIIISPDMIWILILQGYSRFMDKYSELFRDKYVNFEGKKEIEVKRIGIFPEGATPEIWQDIIDAFTEAIKREVGNEIISNLQSDFTTTEEVTLATSQATIMSAMKNYFEFNLGMGGCGISSITLEGTLEDWEKIKSKLNFLSAKHFGLQWWTKHLIPIIEKIISTKSYYDKNGKINNDLKNFWKDMIRVKDFRDFYDPYIINGWIIKFIPNISENTPKIYEEIHKEDIPDQILACPIKLTVYYPDRTKTIHNCDLLSGFYGMSQNRENYSVRPIIGYSLISKDKSNLQMTEKEIAEVFSNF